MIPGFAQWVRGAVASTPGPTLVSTRARSELQVTLGIGPEAWLAGLAEESSDYIGHREPGFGHAGPQLRLWMEWLDVRTLLALCGLRPPIHADVEDAGLVTELVQQEISTEKLLRVLHLHQGHFTLALYDVLQAVPLETRAEVMAAVERAIYELWDPFAAEIAHDHAKAMTSRRATRDAARLEYIRGVVHGAVAESEFERHTGYRLDRNHVALIASSPTSEPQKLTAAALGALRAVGCTATVHALLAPNLLWAWGTLGNSVKNVSNPPSGCSGCTVVFGMPGAGIAGFRASYREAETVQSLISLVEWRNLGKGLAYGDVGMIAEMAARPEHLYRYVKGQLGPLATGSTYEADLRATVRAYLEANRSTTEAAARLHVAKNTVTYRMKRAEEILGRDLSRNQTELQNALRAVEILGTLPEA